MNVKSNLANDTLTITISGRVDSANAGEFEELVMEAVSDHTDGDIVMDLTSLQYVSSAGLRVFLKSKKMAKSLKLNNASPDVYEIFRVTGFTKLIDISKAGA